MSDPRGSWLARTPTSPSSTCRPHLTPAHDHVSNLVYAARGTDVRHTVCDGTVLMRDREVQTLDEAAVRRRAEERAKEVVRRAEE